MFSSGALGYDEDIKTITFPTCGRLSEAQNVYGCDFTMGMCYQLKGPTASCRIPEISLRYQWQWKDIISSESNPGQRTYLVRGKDKGKHAWHFVVVPKSLEETFKEQVATGTINVADYGFIAVSGWGENPSDDIRKNTKLCAPSYFH